MDQKTKSIAAKAPATGALFPAEPGITIDNLHLNLKGIPPATAEAAVHLLGPALAHALHHPQNLTITHTSNAQDLATAIANQLAQRLRSAQP
ncbi:hypothetical protein ACVW0Y_001123 [Pseudomonas sp. TE3786]